MQLKENGSEWIHFGKKKTVLKGPYIRPSVENLTASNFARDFGVTVDVNFSWSVIVDQKADISRKGMLLDQDFPA